jgi:ketosteroid isomerase-like protein
MDMERVVEVYQNLSKEDLSPLAEIYDEHVIFEDPAHRLEGAAALTRYFQNLYANVEHCAFVISDRQQLGDQGFLTWTMSLIHPKLNRGQTISVQGASHIKFAKDRIIYQRDYFDLGEMLYEGVPILGSVVRGIKKRLGQ